MAQPKSIAGIILFFIIIVGDILTGAVSSHTQGGSSSLGLPLGVWANMPFNTTELMGNTSYRGLLLTRSPGGETGLNVGLQVGCTTPSNTIGAALQLQYANYSDTTHLNTSLFVNIGSAIPIDNSANWACPGFLEASTGLLPVIGFNPVIFQFRVIGTGGGGIGDNPRFDHVSVYISQTVFRIATVIVVTRSTTAFTAAVYTTYPVSGSTVENFDWLASTNGVLVESGANSCTIAVASNTCNVVTTFGTSFAGTPNVVCSSRNQQVTSAISLGTISLLSAQTLTV